MRRAKSIEPMAEVKEQFRPEIQGLKAASAVLLPLDGLTPEECEVVASIARELENMLPKDETSVAEPRPTDRATITTAQATRLLELTHDSQLRSLKQELDAQ